MRAILYSPGFGAGWTSWATGSEEQMRFMLSHPGLVAAVEEKRELTAEEKEKAAAIAKTAELEPWQCRMVSGHVLLALPGFIKEWRERFGDKSLPYFGGLRDLTVMYVGDNDLVRIDEYDGSESVTVRGHEDGWL